MRSTQSFEIAVPIDAVWSIVADPSRLRVLQHAIELPMLRA